MKTNFYEISQNNSGGSFTVNETLCHRLFIEANNADEATAIAERLGCYWNGVDDGMDCECCGDRWNTPYSEVAINDWKKKGYPVSVFGGKDVKDNPIHEKEWFVKYGTYPRLEEPDWDSSRTYPSFSGKIYFDTIEQYAQFLADAYGWTTPDSRVFYLNGKVVEINKNNKTK